MGEEQQVEENAVERYSFRKIDTQNPGMVLKKYKNVLMCCSFEKYGYSIVQKLYADEVISLTNIFRTEMTSMGISNSEPEWFSLHEEISSVHSEEKLILSTVLNHLK